MHSGHLGRHAGIGEDRRGDAEPPVEEVSPKIIRYRARLRVITYRVRLDVPRELVVFVSGLLVVVGTLLAASTQLRLDRALRAP